MHKASFWEGSREGREGRDTCQPVASAAQAFLSSYPAALPAPAAGYTVPRNLLIRFANDTIDQTPELASTLQARCAVLCYAVAGACGLQVVEPSLCCTHMSCGETDCE